MKQRKSLMTLTLLCVVACFVEAGQLTAADHLDAPAVMDDGRLDINDLYVFVSPERSNRTVMIMTVNPVAGVMSPRTFQPAGRYRFEIDNNGDANPNVVLQIQFGPVKRNRTQRFIVTRNGKMIGKGETGRTSRLRSRGGGLVHCGLFDDPFFFDLNGFNDGFNFTGDDFFAGLNVSAIVIEIPSNRLTRKRNANIGVVARTFRKREVVDRIGRPAINTVLIPSDLKDEFNVTRPVNDLRVFGDTVQASIEALNGGDSTTAAALTEILLPDVLTFDTTNDAGFLNGRQLADDVIDAELDLLTNGAVTTDGVDMNDLPFPGAFPYLAPPH